MGKKVIHVDWYPHDALIDLSIFKSEEIAVLIQVINLIYTRQGPIKNDPAWISGFVLDVGSTKCRRIIKTLIDKGCLYEDPGGFLQHKRCKKELDAAKNRMKIASESGKKGNEIRHGNKQNQ